RAPTDLTAGARASSSPPARSDGAADVSGAGAAGPRRYSPVVQRVAAEHGVDLELVPGSGRGGRVTKKDVLAWIEAGGNGSAPAAPEERPLHSESPYRPDPEPAPVGQATGRDAATGLGGVTEPLSRMRQSIGGAMLRSQQQAATCTTIAEC